MPADYLSYWKPATAKAELEHGSPLLVHAASAQFGRITPGDTVWIVTTYSGGTLVLLGPIVVWRRTDQRTAAELLGTDNLWEASHHILAAPGHAAVLREVEIGDLAGLLRFESDRDRLDVSAPSGIGRQLQTMRRLTADSAAMLRTRWAEEDDVAEAMAEVRRAPVGAGPGAGFGDPITNREVEAAAVARVTRELQGAGWQVDSVERARIGYDLLCTRADGERRHVEVKGVRGPSPSFIITQAEAMRAAEDPHFWLYLVTTALGPAATVHVLSGQELCEAYTFAPLAYRAVPGRR